MMRAKYVLLTAALAMVAGCGWESGGSGDFSSWNESDTRDFSGTYVSANGGVLVTQYGDNSAGVAGQTSYSETVGVGSGNVFSYAGTLSRTPVVRSTLTISCGDYSFTDASGDGRLVGSAPNTIGRATNTSGTVVYETGHWTIRLNDPLDDFHSGVPIIANYEYMDDGMGAAGNSGRPIYHITVAQKGNLLTFTDSNGARYNGYITGISAMATTTNIGIVGGSNLSSAGTAQFEVQGQSANGRHVRIVGVMERTATVLVGGGLTMRASWIEDGGRTADIDGVAN